MKIRGYAWDQSDGSPQAGVDVDLIKRSDSSVLDSTTTDADGMWEFEENGNPYGIVDNLIDDPGGFRRMFGDVSLFRYGAWSDGELIEMLAVVSDGVVPNIGDEYQLTYPGGMAVTLNEGLVKIQQMPCRFYTTQNLTVPANVSGVTRTDCILVRAYLTGDDIGKTEIVYTANKDIPEQDVDIWEIILYTLAIPHGAASVSAGNVTDVREFATYPVEDIDATSIGLGTVNNTEFGRLDGVTANIQTQLDGKSSTSHTHTRAGGFSVTIGDGVSTVPAGYYMAGEIPKDIEITSGRIWADQSTTATFNMFLETSADWDTTSLPWEDPTDSPLSALPSLTAAVTAAIDFTAADVNWASGQFLILKVTTNNNATQITFSFRYNETI